tara:strand:- start:2296 stop:2748 length:453 start_codon:yes stop_codon:yes gene_type:complete
MRDARARFLYLTRQTKDDEEQSTPAPPEDQIEGSKKNPKGSAGGDSTDDIKFSKQTEKSIQSRIDEHNDEVKEKNMATWRRLRMPTAKKVVRRGFGAFSTSHRPNMNRVQWGLARLKAFSYLLLNDKPRDSKYITDNDLLPKQHPKSTKD